MPDANSAFREVESVDALGGGAINELFREELATVLANIDDPMTEPETKRQITLIIDFYPDSERRKIAMEYSSKHKTAPIRGATDQIIISHEGKKPVAYENIYKDSELFDKKPNLQEVAKG